LQSRITSRRWPTAFVHNNLKLAKIAITFSPFHTSVRAPQGWQTELASFPSHPDKVLSTIHLVILFRAVADLALLRLGVFVSLGRHWNMGRLVGLVPGDKLPFGVSAIRCLASRFGAAAADDAPASTGSDVCARARAPANSVAGVTGAAAAAAFGLSSRAGRCTRRWRLPRRIPGATSV